MAEQREREIFEASLALPREERERFVRQTCGGKADLEQRILHLLAAHDRAEVATTEVPSRLDMNDPEQIGPYKILERIGEGGMGIVYIAEQTRPVRRRVALKIIKLGMDTKEVIARFDSERQALALMNHPNIARILDAGATELGLPYFVMEYVAGTSIVDYCNRRRMPIDDRLRLFAQVCLAVQHAHQKGVIHRDLKPTNILVAEDDGSAYPMVIDFGIAKATNQRLTELTLYTKHGHVIGTPEYMSPEQAEMSATDVDTRSDVYSLGVVLYELLVGVRPFDFGKLNKGYHEIQRVIREVDPPPPSVRLTRLTDGADDHARRRSSTPPVLVRKLRGDLDWVAMKALAKDRGRRYGSPAEFADDVKRFLNDERVSAGPPGVLYRARKLARRYRTAMTAAAALGVSTVALTIGLSLRPAASAVEGSPRVLVLPFEFLGPTDDAYFAEGISEEISDRLSGLMNLTVLGRQTAIHASASGMSLERIADELNAEFILEGTVRVQRVTDGPDQIRIRVALTSTESLSQLWTETYDGSVDDLFGAQVDVATRVVEAVGIELPVAEEQYLLAQPTEDLEAYDFYLRGNDYARRSELEPDMRRALELYERAIGLDPEFAAAWASASVMRSRIRWRGYDGSDANLRLAKEAGERALTLDPGNAGGHYALGYYYYYGFRDYDSALDHFLAANELRTNDSPKILFALGLVHRRQGDWDQAIASLRRALSQNPRHAEVAIILGETHLALGAYAEAERYFDRAIAIAPDRPAAHLFKSWLYLAWKPDTRPAVDALREGWDAVGGARLFGLFGRYISETDWWISRVLASDERYQRMFEAVDPFAVGIDSVAYYLHRGELHRALRQRDISLAYYDSARTVLEARGVSPPSSTGRAESFDNLTIMERSERATEVMRLGVAYAGLGKRDAAIDAASYGAKLFTPEFDALHGSQGLLQLGLIHGMLGDREAAVGLLESVLSGPSAFQIGMLRHDSTLASLLEDPRLARLLRTQ